MRVTLALVFLAGLAACSAPAADDNTDVAADPTAAQDAEATATSGDDASSDGETPAPPPPGSDIYLFALSWTGAEPSLGEARGVIGTPGYDNQPYFTADGGVLYTAAGESGNTDIWRYDLAADTTSQLTDTPDASEYSPKVPPGEAALSYLYQPPGGYAGNAYLAEAGNENPRAAHTLAPVGYYEFSGDMQRVAVFNLGEPNTLQLIDRSTTPETVTHIADEPGRTFWRAPRGQGVFVSTADADAQHTIQYLDYASGTLEAGAALPEGVQDFVIHGLPNDALAILTTQGDQLVYWSGDAWVSAGDLGMLSGVTRLAVSPDGSIIAIVAEE